MTDKHFDEDLLVAYADGELGTDDLVLVKAAIAADPSLQARVDTFKQSGQLLKSSIDIKNQVTPDHIVFRIREIEAAAKKKRLIAPVESTSWPLISWRFLSSLGGSFAAGLACAVFLISPGFMTETNDPSSALPDSYSEQIVMRGTRPFELPYIQQAGVDINDGGSIREGSFSFTFKSPISGRYSINEITDTLDACRSTERSGSPQDCGDISSGTVREGETISRQFEIDDQDSLQLRVTISNTSTTVEHNVSFQVNQP